jgi:hypothetical protein
VVDPAQCREPCQGDHPGGRPLSAHCRELSHEDARVHDHCDGAGSS